MEYKLVIDQAVVDKYNAYYFTQHPRAKKPPIDRPIMPSLNQIMILQRIQIASLKAKYKEFGMWFIKSLGYENLQLDKFEMFLHVCMPTKRRFDLDNAVGAIKLLADSFTETGFIIDDNSSHMTKLTITGEVDKDNPRTEIIIDVVDR